MRRDMPGTLWVAIVALAVITLATLAAALKMRPLVPLVGSACNAVLLIGLVRGQKWAYVLTVVFCVLGVAVGFAKGCSYGLGVLFGNGIVLVPVLLCTDFFFPAHDRERDV